MIGPVAPPMIAWVRSEKGQGSYWLRPKWWES